MKNDEQKTQKRRIYSTRTAGRVRQNDAESKIHQRSVQTVSRIRKSSADLLYGGPFRIEVEIYGKCRSDIDNVLKGILDSLNGIAYRDDRQCIEARIKLCEGSGDL